MKRLMVVALIACFAPVLPSSAGTLRVVAALPDLGSIGAYIGGDKVEVSAIAKSNSNPHSVEVFPSYMAEVSRAAIYLKCGLDLDQWSDAIIDGSRNNDIRIIDCSKGINVLEKPTGKVDASKGDVHPYGNPHYWLNPENGIVIAENIATGLEQLDPTNADYYAARLDQFKKECTERMAVWRAEMNPLVGTSIITYHSSWVYFADAFGLSIIAQVEPFPGIPPNGNHLARLVDLIRREKVGFVIQEPYFPDDAGRFLSRETGVKVLKCAPSCSDVKADAYLSHFDAMVTQITAAVGGKQS